MFPSTQQGLNVPRSTQVLPSRGGLVPFARRGAPIYHPSEPPRLSVPFGRRDLSLYLSEHPRLSQFSGHFGPNITTAARRSQPSYPKQNSRKLPSPIQRLPVELLGEIFKVYLQEPRSDGVHFDIFSSSLNSTRYSNANPMVLGHICRDWRAISLSMPTLWSAIAVHIPRASHVPVIKLWLDRAANCPLALTLSQSMNPVLAELEATNQILFLFLTRAHLWRHIKFHFSHWVAHGASLLNLPETPLLESVHFNMPAGDRDPASIDKFWRHIHSLPTLRKVSWDALSYFRELRTHVPWGQLTWIDLPRIYGSPEFEQLLWALQQCQELIELRCDIDIPSELSMPVLSATLPKLRILMLTVHGNNNPALFMKHLNLPSLTSFTISHFYMSPNPRLMNWLDDLITRSACQLRILHLFDIELEEGEVLDFLSSRGAQHLVDFTLSVWSFTDRMAEALTFNREAKAGLLPNLQMLDLPRCDTSKGSVFKMISSRLPVLKTARLSDANSMLASDLLALQSLVLAGCHDLRLIVKSIVDGKHVERRLA